jgi:hypothetical protein
MPFVLIADLVAQARDEDGMPVVPVFVYGLIEERGKSGVVMRGRPVDGAGNPGAEVDIPTGDWHRMRFPMAAMEHSHDTFWNASGQLAYVEIKADPERLWSAPKPADSAIDRTVVRRGRGNRPLPEDELVERAREYRKTARSNRAAAARLAAELYPTDPKMPIQEREKRDTERARFINRIRQRI